MNETSQLSDLDSPQKGEQAPAVRSTLGLLPLIALSAALTGPAVAQDGGDISLEQINVQGGTGNTTSNSYRVDKVQSKKVTAPLADTARSIEVITKKQIQERNQTTLSEVLRTTPGVTLGAGEGGVPIGDRPYIRGFDSGADLYIDGIRSLGRVNYESFNLESIEISKGPSSSADGRGGTGGSINLTTKQPIFGETFQEVSGTVGSDPMGRFTYDGNFATDRVAGRLNVMGQTGNVAGRNAVFNNRWGVAPSLAFRLGDSTTLTANLYHLYTFEIPDYGHPFANANYVAGTGDTSHGTGTTADPFRPVSVNRDFFYGSVNRDFRETRTTAGVLKLDHEFSNGWELNSALAYIGAEAGYIVSHPNILAGGVTTSGAQRQAYRRTETLSHQTTVSGEFDTGAVQHSFAAGYEITGEAVYNGSYGAQAFPNQSLYNPNPFAPVAGVRTPTAVTLNQTTNTRSLYAFDTMKFGEKWLFNVGARYDNYFIQSGTTPAINNTSNLFNYQVGLAYKPLPNGTIYFSHSTSSNPPGMSQGINNDFPLTAANSILDPEVARAYELGTKWEMFDRRLLLTAALFYIDKSNTRVNDIFGNPFNAGRTTSKGLEIGVSGNVTDRWSIAAGYTYLDARLVDGGFTGGVPNPNNGNRLTNTAEHTFGFWTSYAATEKLTIGGGANYVGERYTNAGNTALLPASWQVDLMAAYKFNENARLQLNVNNLFNNIQYISAHSGAFAGLAPGRSASLKFNYRF